ncbi:MAG: SDR family oxidoreductase [Pedobacter sp.]
MDCKVVIVTGVTSGIGYALAEELLTSGSKVIGIGRNLERVSNLIQKYPSSFIFKKFDLRFINEIEQMITDSFKAFGKFDSLVHCAGMEETLPLSLHTPDKVQAIFDLNVFSTIELIRLVSKKKFSNDFGSIVLLSSVMGILGQPGKIGYCATKSSILGIVRASALELAKRRIRVNAISPGVIKTPMTDKLFAQLSETGVDEIVKMHPLGIGNVCDVVPLICFLVSDSSKWITGQNLVIDGGYSIQ